MIIQYIKRLWHDHKSWLDLRYLKILAEEKCQTN